LVAWQAASIVLVLVVAVLDGSVEFRRQKSELRTPNAELGAVSAERRTFYVSAFRPRAKERQGTQRISFGDEHLKTNFKSIPLRTSAYLCVMLRRDSLERQETEIRMQNAERQTVNAECRVLSLLPIL
jgi:hypothetical protein